MHLKNIQKAIFFTFMWCVSISFAYASPDNIASLAKVSASSSLSIDFEPSKAIDGHIRILNKDEWVSNSKMTFGDRYITHGYSWTGILPTVSIKLFYMTGPLKNRISREEYCILATGAKLTYCKFLMTEAQK